MKNDPAENQESIKAIPEPTLRRLPIYYQLLKSRLNAGSSEISCTTIADALHLTAIQVRKDLEITEASGKPKVGYNIKELIAAIENFLGWNSKSEAFLVGAGNLGSALIGYQGFKEYGLMIIAAFDNNPAKINTSVYGKRIFDIKKLSDMVRRMKVSIGILTVPAQYAQESANLMTEAGIRAIWNFSPTKIICRPDIVVQHENLACSLAVLSKKISEVAARRIS